MRNWAASWRGALVRSAFGVIVLCGVAAPARSADVCEVPGYMLFGDSLLQRATEIGRAHV